MPYSLCPAQYNPVKQATDNLVTDNLQDASSLSRKSFIIFIS